MIEFDTADAEFVTPKGRRVVCRYRVGTNDWNTLTSCLVGDEYGLRELDLSGVAFDIGAHIGGVSVALAVDNPALTVVAVEPVEANRVLLELNARQNGVSDRIAILPYAAGGPDESATKLHVNFRGNEHAWHHAFIGTTENGNPAIAEPWRLGSDHDVLTVLTVSALTLQVLHDTPVFVKMDCEGAEYAFLQDRVVDDWPLIVGEWHNVGGREIGDIISLLPKHQVTFSGPQTGPGGFRAVRK